MKQAVLLIDCYLYGTIAILAVVLLVLVYLHGQANHLPNPFARKNIVYRPAPKARGVLLGKKYGLLAYSPEPDEGHIINAPTMAAPRPRQNPLRRWAMTGVTARSRLSRPAKRTA